MCAGLKLPLVVGNSPAISVPAFALNRSVCAAIHPCWPRSPPAPSCWPSSSSATLSLGWSWPWHCTPPPTHRTDWRSPRDQASAQCDQQSPSTAASLAILAQSKLPLSLLCLLVSQPTQLGERLHVSMFICSRHDLYLMFFRFCAAGACVLLLRTQARGPPKIHRSLGRNMPSQIRSEFPRPPSRSGKYIALGIPRTHPRCAGQTLNPMFMFALGQRSGPTEQNPAGKGSSK